MKENNIMYSSIESDCPYKKIRSEKFTISNNEYYLKIISRECRGELKWITVRRRSNMELIASMPFIMREGKYGNIISALPFFNTHSSIYPKNASREDLRLVIEGYQEYANTMETITSTIVSDYKGDMDKIIQEDFDHCSKQVRLTYTTRLPEEPEELIWMLQGSKRRNIRKAEKLGVEVVKGGGAKEIDQFYRIYEKNMKIIGAQTKTKNYFKEVMDKNSGLNSKLFLAQLDGRIIAGLFLIYSGDVCEYIAPAIENEYRNTQCLSKIIYEAMKEMIRLNIKTWNWGGCQTNQIELIRFKKSWRSEEKSYSIYVKTILPFYEDLDDRVKQEYKYFYISPPKKDEQLKSDKEQL